jgi:hypothetical protein
VIPGRIEPRLFQRKPGTSLAKNASCPRVGIQTSRLFARNNTLAVPAARTGTHQHEPVSLRQSASRLYGPRERAQRAPLQLPRRGVAVGVTPNAQVNPGAESDEPAMLTGGNVQGGVVPVAAGDDADGDLRAPVGPRRHQGVRSGPLICRARHRPCPVPAQHAPRREQPAPCLPVRVRHLPPQESCRTASAARGEGPVHRDVGP